MRRIELFGKDTETASFLGNEVTIRKLPASAWLRHIENVERLNVSTDSESVAGWYDIACDVISASLVMEDMSDKQIRNELDILPQDQMDEVFSLSKAILKFSGLIADTEDDDENNV